MTASASSDLTPIVPFGRCRALGDASRRLSAAVFVHGLCGHPDEWWGVIARLDGMAVATVDLAERTPFDADPGVRVARVADVLRATGPAVIVGQSLGGRTAIEVAAQHPSLVRALVLIEATPDAGTEDLDLDVRDLRERLRAWPTPFADRDAARCFFADRFGSTAIAEVWVDGLIDQADGRLRPRFLPDIAADALRQSYGASLRPAWEARRCRAVLVRGEHGALSHEQVRALGTTVVTVDGAGHDVHLDRPDAVAAVIAEQVVARIEPATEHDAEALAAVHRRSALAAYSWVPEGRWQDASWLARVRSGGVIVARIAGQVVGLVTIADREIGSLYVDPIEQHHGIGQLRLHAAEQQLGPGPARVWVIEHNHVAPLFYAGAGWQPSGRRRDDVWGPELELTRSL